MKMLDFLFFSLRITGETALEAFPILTYHWPLHFEKFYCIKIMPQLLL